MLKMQHLRTLRRQRFAGVERGSRFSYHVSFSEVGALSPQEAADFDLCEMIRAPVFVRGKAGFAALAEGLRDFAHKETVSDLAGLDAAFVGQREMDNWATIT
jgi:hypothetical protein